MRVPLEVGLWGYAEIDADTAGAVVVIVAVAALAYVGRRLWLARRGAR
ncbi:MAG: hypothetical protein K8W52_28275 [Deltaproteobacteria bacterium]|nr:hypothetical protein [Deltaproteobacteria bacterium]